MRRALYDLLMSAGAIAMLVVILAAFDGRVREQVMMRAQPSVAVVDAEGRVRDVASVFVDVLRDEMQMHATLMIFVLAATVLTVFMLRV
jgi:hypothetical protein